MTLATNAALNGVGFGGACLWFTLLLGGLVWWGWKGSFSGGKRRGR